MFTVFIVSDFSALLVLFYFCSVALLSLTVINAFSKYFPIMFSNERE
jgi:hypothetical protein